MVQCAGSIEINVGLGTNDIGIVDKGTRVFGAQIPSCHPFEPCLGVFHAQCAEEGAAVERAEIAGMEYAGVEDKVAVKCQGGVSPKSDSGIKRPQVAALLQRSQYAGFGMGCGDAAMPFAGVFPSETGRSVGNGLYTHIGGILFTAAVLYEDVDRKVQCMCGSGVC